MFFEIDPMFIVLFLAGTVLVLLLWNIRLEWKLRRLLLGKNAHSLEDTIVSLGKGQEELARFRKELEVYLKNVERRLRSSVRGISTVRFNAFKGSGAGGNQSFATAFLNEEGNGVVFSSLYARDRMSIFAKPVEKHTAHFELTEEEQEALKKAREIQEGNRA